MLCSPAVTAVASLRKCFSAFERKKELACLLLHSKKKILIVIIINHNDDKKKNNSNTNRMGRHSGNTLDCIWRCLVQKTNQTNSWLISQSGYDCFLPNPSNSSHTSHYVTWPHQEMAAVLKFKGSRWASLVTKTCLHLITKHYAGSLTFLHNI